MKIDNKVFEKVRERETLISYQINLGEMKGYKVLMDKTRKSLSIHYQGQCVLSSNKNSISNCLYDKLKVK